VPDVTEQLIPVDGGQIWTEQRGSSDGRPVVLLHAGWCDSSSWDGVITRLPAGTRLVGDRDHADVIGCADALVVGIPGCELTELLGADHLLPLREPALLAELISAQLAR
jgi:hypothetical protein